MKNAVIVSAVRTAIGRAKRGSLKDTRPEELGGMVVKEVVKRAGIDANLVEDLIVGNAMPEASQGMNMARIVSFCAGLPIEVSAVTVNRFCSSGLEAVSVAANKIMVSYIDVAIGAGVESMSMVPMGGFNPSPDPKLMEEWPETYAPMGITAENVAKQFNITREQQDQFAYDSQMKAKTALDNGVFKDQILPVKTFVQIDKPDNRNVDTSWCRNKPGSQPLKKEIVFEVDEAPRADTTLEGLAKLKPVFAQNGSVTAGNSSPLNDGAAAVLLMSEEKAKELGLKCMGYFRFYVTVGTPPEIMGVGPLYAIRKLFQKTGLTKDDIDLFEINEAFASQAYYCTKELGLDMAKVNVNGGGIALGHPLGCTGAKLTTQLLYELEQRNGRYGIVSMCIGGGMGAAGLFERVRL